MQGTEKERCQLTMKEQAQVHLSLFLFSFKYNHKKTQSVILALDLGLSILCKEIKRVMKFRNMQSSTVDADFCLVLSLLDLCLTFPPLTCRPFQSTSEYVLEY